MRFYILAIIYFTPLYSLFAQTLDRQKLECTYAYSWISNTEKPTERKEDYMILKIGDKISDFYSYHTFRYDSLIQVSKANKVSGATVVANRGSLGKRGMAYHIFKNYPSGKLTVTERLANDRYKYTEAAGQDWKILPDKGGLNGYKTQKATCTFRGRQYVAWFTNEIPLPLGPWKFHGLPGLIVKVEDVGGNFKFEMVGLRQIKNHLPMDIEKKQYINVSREEFQKLAEKYHKDPISYINDNTSMKIKVSENSRLVRSLPFNPAELN